MFIISSYEIDKFIVPKNWKFKKFDLKLIKNLERNHPYQRIMAIINKYIIHFFDDEVDNDKEDVIKDNDYFQLLDRYYRYGITFEDSDLYPREFFGYEFPVKYYFKPEKFYSFGIPFNNNLYVYDNSERNDQVPYIIENRYSIKTLLFNDVKTINLDDVDKGIKTLSEVEKWKRKVVNKQTDRRVKLRLVHPNVYHSLITFVAFSKFEKRPFKEVDFDFNSYWDEANRFSDRNLNKYTKHYKHRKMYEDKIYNKIKDFLK